MPTPATAVKLVTPKGIATVSNCGKSWGRIWIVLGGGGHAVGAGLGQPCLVGHMGGHILFRARSLPRPCRAALKTALSSSAAEVYSALSVDHAPAVANNEPGAGPPASSFECTSGETPARSARSPAAANTRIQDYGRLRDWRRDLWGHPRLPPPRRVCPTSRDNRTATPPILTKHASPKRRRR